MDRNIIIKKIILNCYIEDIQKKQIENKNKFIKLRKKQIKK